MLFEILLLFSHSFDAGDTLTIKNNAVKAFNEQYAYAATGSAEVQGPDNAVAVSAILAGTQKITSCGIVRLSARLSKGGAGRAMTYSWSVASDVASVSSISDIQDVLDGMCSIGSKMDLYVIKLHTCLPYYKALAFGCDEGETKHASFNESKLDRVLYS